MAGAPQGNQGQLYATQVPTYGMTMGGQEFRTQLPTGTGTAYQAYPPQGQGPSGPPNLPVQQAPQLGDSMKSQVVPPNTAQSQPNIFQQASGAMTGAMGATGREMNYRPMAVGNYGYGAAQAGSQGYNPAVGQSAGYNAAQAGAQGYNAALLSGSPTVTAQNVQAGQLAGTNLGAYTNPYESQVVGQTLGDLERSRQIQANEAARQAQAAGAFGGSRSAILEAETNRAFADQAARSAAQLRQAGFTNAQQMAQQDIQRRMQADLANQGANLQAGTTTANFAQQAGLANQSALNQAGQFGASAQNVAALQNMAAQNAASQFGAGAANQMTAQNLAAMNQAGQFGASAANTAALQNMGALNQAGQFNASQALQSALANQQAGLQGSQQRLSAAGQMGTLGNLGFGMGQQVQSNMAQQGALQQALQQQIIDAARQQYQGYTGAPQQSLSYLAQALGMAPTPQTQTTKNQLGLMDYLGAAAGAAGIFKASDIALKENIQKIGQTKGGANWYSWTWNDKAKELGLSGESSGVIAQEIQKVKPEAVKQVDGYLAVNYSMVA